MKKIGILILLMAWLVGSAGGFCALLYHGEVPIAIAMLVTIFMSVPSVVEMWKDLTD